MKSHTDQLRNAALTQLEQLGEIARRISRRGQLYQTNTGATFRLATNLQRILICTTDGVESDARLHFEDADHVLISVPRQPRVLDVIDVYFVPSRVVADYARADHAEWLLSCATKWSNTTWQQILDWKDRLCHGYGRKYEPYRLR